MDVTPTDREELAGRLDLSSGLPVVGLDLHILLLGILPR